VQLDGRTISTEEYRFGFQGQEKDDEVKGEGNSLNYRFRMHDPRVGRFFAVDPLSVSYPYFSTYTFSGNRVIDATEIEGLEYMTVHVYINEKTFFSEEPVIKVNHYNPKQRNAYGPEGKTIKYVIHFSYTNGIDPSFNRMFYQSRNVSKMMGSVPIDYGLYAGPTTLYKWNSSNIGGNLTTKPDYSLPSVDAVDEGARKHDMAYDAIGAVGANSVNSDWGAVPADKVLVQTFMNVMSRGVGGQDPLYPDQKITAEERSFAENGALYFNAKIGEKMKGISEFMTKHYGNAMPNGTASQQLDANYNKFLSVYMTKQTDGTYKRKTGMWNSDNTPKAPSK
jgi:RHS repeat-associated protein